MVTVSVTDNKLSPVPKIDSTYHIGANAWKEYVEKYYPNGIPDSAKAAILVAKDLQCDEVH